MWKKLPLVIAALVSCACSSPPELKYPSGQGIRTPLNVEASRPPVPPAMAAPAAPGEPLKAIPLQLFTVNANEDTAMAALRRWTLASLRPFNWNCDIDYLTTDNMRRIEAHSLEQAVGEMRRALDGATVPLDIQLDVAGMQVRCPKEQAPPNDASPLIPVPFAEIPAE